MDIQTLRPLVTPLLLSLLLATSAALLWSASSAQAAETAKPISGCAVLDKQARADLAEIRRAETMLALHRGW